VRNLTELRAELDVNFRAAALNTGADDDEDDDDDVDDDGGENTKKGGGNGKNLSDVGVDELMRVWTRRVLCTLCTRMSQCIQQYATLQT
jgi:hypothetical protein